MGFLSEYIFKSVLKHFISIKVKFSMNLCQIKIFLKFILVFEMNKLFLDLKVLEK